MNSPWYRNEHESFKTVLSPRKNSDLFPTQLLHGISSESLKWHRNFQCHILPGASRSSLVAFPVASDTGHCSSPFDLLSESSLSFSPTKSNIVSEACSWGICNSLWDTDTWSGLWPFSPCSQLQHAIHPFLRRQCCLLHRDRFSIYNPSWPQTGNPPASASSVLRLVKSHVPLPSSQCFIHTFSIDQLQGHCTGQQWYSPTSLLRAEVLSVD